MIFITIFIDCLRVEITELSVLKTTLSDYDYIRQVTFMVTTNNAHKHYYYNISSLSKTK